jgi:hypothetical protein
MSKERSHADYRRDQRNRNLMMGTAFQVACPQRNRQLDKTQPRSLGGKICYCESVIESIIKFAHAKCMDKSVTARDFFFDEMGNYAYCSKTIQQQAGFSKDFLAKIRSEIKKKHDLSAPPGFRMISMGYIREHNLMDYIVTSQDNMQKMYDGEDDNYKLLVRVPDLEKRNKLQTKRHEDEMGDDIDIHYGDSGDSSEMHDDEEEMGGDSYDGYNEEMCDDDKCIDDEQEILEKVITPRRIRSTISSREVSLLNVQAHVFKSYKK